MSNPPPSTMRRDIASAYLVTGARVLAWVLVSALVYRKLGEAAFAMFALGRATIGLLAYTSLGLAPAMVRLLAESTPFSRGARTALPDAPFESVLAYEPTSSSQRQAPTVYASGTAAAFGLALIGLALLLLYARSYGELHVVSIPSKTMQIFVLLLGAGMLARLVSDVPSALLQTHGRIAMDNMLLAAAELVWVALSAWFLLARELTLVGVGLGFAMANIGLWVARFSFAATVAGVPNPLRVRWKTTRRLLAFGLLVTLAQLADFLYAPVDYILINRFLSPTAVADYAPAVQIDGALLLLVTAVAAVMLPKAAIAHTAGNTRLLRRYYIRGTLLTTAVLLLAALCVWAISPWIFRLWLGNDMPATRAILPLVLLHTVIGGSSGVGRSILIGMGRIRPFTTAVLLAGVGNVVLSALAVTVFDLGLIGIVGATVIVVTLRAGIWMPWYVLRCLGSDQTTAENRIAHEEAGRADTNGSE